MPNTINMVPEFTPDEPQGSVQSVITPAEEETPPAEEEKETPSETPAEEKPAEEAEAPLSDDTERLKSEIEFIKAERDKVLKELQEARGQKREFKREELSRIDQKIDELKDVNPEDASLIEKVLRSKGYITRQESHEMFYKAVEQDEIAKFLNEFPEYKPENDSNDLNWNALSREFQIYRKPDDPRQIGELLKRVHQAIAKPSSERNLTVQKQQIKTAGMGKGGIQRSSSSKILDEDKRAMLIHGGWSKEEINKIEKNL